VSEDSDLKTYDYKVPSRNLLRLGKFFGAILLWGGFLLMFGSLGWITLSDDSPNLRDWLFGNMWVIGIPVIVVIVGGVLGAICESLEKKYFIDVPQGRITKKFPKKYSSNGGYYFKLTIVGYTRANVLREFTFQNVDYGIWASLEESQLYEHKRKR